MKQLPDDNDKYCIEHEKESDVFKILEGAQLKEKKLFERLFG